MRVWIYRILTIVAILVFQLTISREIRSYIFEQVVSDNKTYLEVGYHERIIPFNIGERVATLQVYFNGQLKYVSVKLPFGMYFIFSFLLLLFAGAEFKYLMYIISIHSIILLIIVPSIYTGLYFKPTFLLLVDFMSRYIIPLSSLGIVAIHLANKQVIKYANKP